MQPRQLGRLPPPVCTRPSLPVSPRLTARALAPVPGAADAEQRMLDQEAGAAGLVSEVSDMRHELRTGEMARQDLQVRTHPPTPPSPTHPPAHPHLVAPCSPSLLPEQLPCLMPWLGAPAAALPVRLSCRRVPTTTIPARPPRPHPPWRSASWTPRAWRAAIWRRL